MWVTPAFAQDAATTATSTGASSQLLSMVVPLILIFGIMYFLLIRPQQAKLKAHKALIGQIRRGDTIVTNSGLVGKITKVVDDTEIELEIAQNTKVRLLRAAIAEVRSKGEPVKEEA